MDEIKVDVALILEQSKQASNALENMEYCIKDLKQKYSAYLDDMKSNEFIKEFDESIGELLEQTEDLSNESIKQVIDGLATIAEAIDDADIALSKL